MTYSPYGTQNVTAGSTSDEWVQNPYGFKNGNRTDNGAIVKFGLRWYLATTGTWTQRDTLDAPLDPKNANRYGYAGSDPINGSDPTGRVSSFGTYATQCASGALQNGLLKVGLATSAIGPAGLIGSLAVGCALSVAVQATSDYAGSRTAAGANYALGIGAATQIGKRFL